MSRKNAPTKFLKILASLKKHDYVCPLFFVQILTIPAENRK